MTEGAGDLGRFAEPAILILISLGAGPRHGYAIMADAEAISGSPIGPGTLYAALARLEARGLIEPMEAEQRRRPYRLTAAGELALRTQLDGLSSLVRIGRARLERPAD